MIDLRPVRDTLLALDKRAAGSIAVALGLIALLLLVWRWYRRRRAAAALLANITGGAFEYLRDVLVPDGQGGSLHVDFLLLTARGCVVIDMRNIAGNIFGGDQMTEWTVMHREQRYTFANPQTSLYDRIAVVRAQVAELPVEGRVVFAPRGRFPKGLPRHTLMLDSLAAEFPAAERAQAGSPPDTWRAEWTRLVAACRPSSLVAPKAAI
ncbi:MAG: NERD domain-containing protein [Gammaproteobacteria bacterium]|nr:NERD domain-containing protein [Gammaproteobacteria bacterium]MDE2250272.1 NERD domain-containing protein [Gammaproteobacteria bacterium]